MSTGLLGRLRGRSKAPEAVLPPTPSSRQGSRISAGEPSPTAAGGSGVLGLTRRRSKSKLTGPSPAASPVSIPQDHGALPASPSSSSASLRQGSAAPQSPLPRVHSTTISRQGAPDRLALLQRDEELRRERILNRAATELQEISTVCLTNALVITRREGLGLGQSKGDMWCMKHIAQAKKRSEEAVEFSDGDGDAVRMLLHDGGIKLCINGVVRGEPRQMRYLPEEKVLRSKPWRIGLDKVKDEDLPLLLAHLGSLFSKGGIVHNLPTDIPEDDDDEVAEIKRQMAAERANTGAMLDDLEKAREAEAKLRRDIGDLHTILGQKADEAENHKQAVETAGMRNTTLQAAVDQAVARRRGAEDQLAAKEAECESLREEAQHGRLGDKNEIDNLTSRLAAALDEIGRYKLALADAELRGTDMQNSLTQAAVRRQQAEVALAEKEAALAGATETLADQHRKMEHSLGTDTEALEQARRAALVSDEHAKREYITLWHNAERQIQALKDRHFALEKMSLEQLEATHRQLLEAEERGRREYQGIWLRAELRNVANSTASQLERGAVLALKERLSAEKERLRRSRHAVAKAYPLPHAATLARCYRQLAFYALWKKYSRLADTSAAALGRHMGDRRVMRTYFMGWRLWLAVHTHDRALAIKAYMQERPLFYLDETVRRLRLESFEERARRALLSRSHANLVERVGRLEIACQAGDSMCNLYEDLVCGVPLQGTRAALQDQLSVVHGLYRLEEQKVREMDRTLAHIMRQRDELHQHNTLLRGENSKIDVLRLLYAHLDGKRLIEVEHQAGIIAMLHAMLFPKRSICADGGWVLTSLADWSGGGTWAHRFIWLDVTKGQLLYSSRDPRLSGPDVKCIRLANIVAVEVELFSDGLQPPPVSRYQQLGFYIELAKGGKHRFCAATVGERTEWLNCLRTSLLKVWRTSETPVTLVTSGAGGGGGGGGIASLPSGGDRALGAAGHPGTPPSSPSPSYRKQRKAGAGVGGGGGGGVGSVVPPLRLPSPRSPRSPRPAFPSESPPRSSRLTARSQGGPPHPHSGMTLEHLSYIGLR